MSPNFKSLGIDQLTVDERIALALEIWESIGEERHLDEAQRLELERRLAEHEANPGDVVPWETVKTEALARFRT